MLAAMPLALCCQAESGASGGAGQEMSCCKNAGPGHSCHMGKTRAQQPAPGCVLRSACTDPAFAWLAGLGLVAPVPAPAAFAFGDSLVRLVSIGRAPVLGTAPHPLSPPPRA